MELLLGRRRRVLPEDDGELLCLLFPEDGPLPPFLLARLPRLRLRLLRPLPLFARRRRWFSSSPLSYSPSLSSSSSSSLSSSSYCRRCRRRCVFARPRLFGRRLPPRPPRLADPNGLRGLLPPTIRRPRGDATRDTAADLGIPCCPGSGLYASRKSALHEALWTSSISCAIAFSCSSRSRISATCSKLASLSVGYPPVTLYSSGVKKRGACVR